MLNIVLATGIVGDKGNVVITDVAIHVRHLEHVSTRKIKFTRTERPMQVSLFVELAIVVLAQLSTSLK